MGAPLSVFNALMLEKSPEILNFLIKVLTFLMSFKSTLYLLYFQKLCRIYTEKFCNDTNKLVALNFVLYPEIPILKINFQKRLVPHILCQKVLMPLPAKR